MCTYAVGTLGTGRSFSGKEERKRLVLGYVVLSGQFLTLKPGMYHKYIFPKTRLLHFDN